MGLRILVTGAAGLVGAELCRLLAARGHAVVGMTRCAPRAGDFRTADGPLDPPPHPGGAPRPGLAWTAGDVRVPGLGLDDPNLMGALDRVVHCAAVTDFAAAPAQYRAVNVAGTRNVADFARAAGAGLVQVSTAYVCGERSGPVAEAPARGDAPFANGYEASKAEAEETAVASGAALAIARPSIVVGRSGDGAIGRFENVYAFLKLIGSGRLTALPAAAGASLDLVPVDHVAAGLSDLVEGFDRARGGVFHLVSGQPTPVSDLVAIDYPGFRVPRLVAPGAFDPEGLGPAEAYLHAMVTARFASYLRRDPRFRADNLDALSGRACPPTGPGFLARVVAAAVRAGYLVPDPDMAPPPHAARHRTSG